MVKKLFKHEFKAWLRVLPLFWLAMLGVAVAGRVVQFFETETVYYYLVFGSAMLAFAGAAFVLLGAPTVFDVYRFYRNLFTGEGYLSFTLPVSPTQHLLVKLLTAACFQLMTLAVVLLSSLVLIAGDVLIEVLKAAAYLWKELIPQIPEDVIPHLIGYVVEYGALILVSVLGSSLMYYSCICIGQLARKNRVLLAVGVFFGYQIITQILSTGVSLLFMVLSASGVMEKLVELMDQHPFATYHVILGGTLLLAALFAVLYWIICHRIMSKRLNLE